LAAKASQLFLPTLREDPTDAEAVSHKLLVRGGFIRQVSAGLWTYLPLGWTIHRKVEQIIREELAAIGAQEWLAPVLTPIELWEATGRAGIPEIFHTTDRAGRRFILPLTHEETFTFHAREIRSYKELPQLWYHFQIKDRDEPRPRGGLLRVREFIMTATRSTATRRARRRASGATTRPTSGSSTDAGWRRSPCKLKAGSWAAS
jgi:prolyl-tRNA synthetase